jgi:hypothetical protein
VLLSHLSKSNNCPELVLDLFAKNAGNTFVAVASRNEESAVYEIVNTAVVPEQKKLSENRKHLLSKQLNLFQT